MMWIKKGLLFSESHCQSPVILSLDGNNKRIYYSSRDGMNRSHTLFIDIEVKKDELKIVRVSEQPILLPGPLGAFDESGAMGSCIVKNGTDYFMYYTGWNVGKTIPFRLSIGLAISNDEGETFKKYSDGPILDRSIFDPYLVGSPMVLNINGTWKMWYVSGKKWEITPGGVKHYYHIRYASSRDGIHWNPEGIVCIDFKDQIEYAIAKPCVIFDGEIYRMWYSYRASKISETYRIGYAESKNGMNWIRKDDKSGIDVSPTGWDNEMICYAFIFDHKGERFMLYNGNGYGKTGFGYAILDHN